MTMRNARAIRERIPMTLEEVAARTSIRFSHLSRFERGKNALGIPKLKELAAFYTEKRGEPVTIDDLVAAFEPSEGAA